MTKPSDGSFGFGTESWPGAAKLLEEAGEVTEVLGKLVQTLSKLIVNGGDTDYWGDRDLHQSFIEELGDLSAAIIFFGEQNFEEDDLNRIGQRAHAKLAKYATWKGKREDGDEVTVHGRIIDGREAATTVRRAAPETTRVLSVGDRIIAYPCDVTVTAVGYDGTVGRCSSCGVTHVIDRRRYESGKGPWQPA